MAEYEGGIGGKFRRRPLRRAAVTPYDRPPATIRGARTVHVAGLPADGRGGWLSKLVDPASRMIATGASRIFSSVFRKRLPALPPPPIPEGNHQSRQDIPESACTEENGRDNQRENFDNDGIAELEQLLKQKTFTRVEFDRLTELLRLRTVEPYKGETEDGEKQCQQQQQCLNNEKRESINVPAGADRIGSSVVYGSLVVPSDSLTDQASPAELAKAYMGTRPSKSSASASAVGLCNQVCREDKCLPSIPSASKPLDLSVAPRSVIRFSGIPEHPENGYQTPRPLGRSAIYRMSRSPYFKVNPRTNVKGGPLNGEGYTYTTSSQCASRSAVLSGGQQVLKRGSSVLDGDFGSVGPIRRIRQKYNLSSPPKGTRSSLSGSPLSTPVALTFKKFEGSTSVQKPLLLGQPMHRITGSQVAGNGISNASIAPIPTQSSETAHKLFQQLDRLLPSPKERSSEIRTIARDESPSKLTLDMLQGRSLRSMEELDSSKISCTQGNAKLGTTSDSHFPTGGSFFYGKMDMIEENGHPKSHILGVKVTSETNEVKNASIPSTSNPGRMFSNSVFLTSAAPPQSEKPSFQTSVNEESLQLDEDEYMKNLASPLITGKNGIGSRIPESQNAISETAISETELKVLPKKDIIVSEKATSEAESKIPNYKGVTFGSGISERPKTISSERIAVFSSISSMEADKKASFQSIISETGISLPIVSDTSSHSQQHLTPTMPTTSLNQPTLLKEQTTSVFNFGSKTAGTLAFSSTTMGVRDTAGVKLDTGSGSDLKSSNSHATITPAEGSNLNKGSEIQKSGDLFKSFGSAVSSGSSMSSKPVLFGFGASTSSSISNGTLGSSSPAFSVSATLAIKPSENPASSIFPSSSVTTPSSTPSLSSASPIPPFQFGPGTSSATAVSTPLDKAQLSASVTKPANTSSFSISNSTTLGESIIASTRSSSSSTTTFAFSGSGNAPSASMASGIGTNKNISSSMLASSSLFSSMGVSSSSLAPSYSFPSTGSSVFGFCGSSQSSSSSTSFDNSKSQKSTAFGGTGGSIFGTQSNLSGNGASLISQSSTSNAASFSSSPEFGLSNSSSSTFTNTPSGSTTSGAQTFNSSSRFSIPAGSGPSSANTSSSFMPAASSGPFGSSSQASTSSIFGSVSTSSTSSSTGFSFRLPVPGSGSSTSLSSTSPSTGFSFGLPAPGSGSSPIMFGSSTGSVFSFTSSGPSTSLTPSSAQPAFSLPNPALGFNSGSSGSPGNDRMNVEDNMTDDTNQAPSFPTFGQPANQPATPSFVFGSPAVQPGAPSGFQFGSHSSGPQNPSPFQETGNLELPQGGSFSLGSGGGGGDKSGRRYVRVKGNKNRKR